MIEREKKLQWSEIEYDLLAEKIKKHPKLWQWFFYGSIRGAK